MDVYDDFYKQLQISENIFLKFSKDESLGFPVSNELKVNFDKNGYALMNCNDIQSFEEIRGIYYKNVLNEKLNNYSYYEWLACLSEGVLLDYALPLFSRVLPIYPLLSGFTCKGEVLFYISTINDDFWHTHLYWKDFFKNIVIDIFSKYTNEQLHKIFTNKQITSMRIYKGRKEK